MNKYMNQVGLIGLDDLGQALLWNLTRNCFSISCYDSNKLSYDELKNEGFSCFDSIDSMLKNLYGQKIVFITGKWSDITSLMVSKLIEKMPSTSIIIDCTNSSYKDCVINYKRATSKKIAYLDASIIGTLDDVTWGFSIMVGGNPIDAGYIRDVIVNLLKENGYFYSGSIGSSHYAKMIHDSIQNSHIQSIIEGIKMFEKSIYIYDLKKIMEFLNNNSMFSGKLLNTINSTFSNELISDLKNENKTISNLNQIDLTTISSFVSTSVSQQIATPTITASAYSTINMVSKKTDNFSRLIYFTLLEKFKEIEE